MIRFIHSFAASVLAILLECGMGNFGWMFPLAECVIFQAALRLFWGTQLAIGFLTGLLLDLLYWHDFPFRALIIAFAFAAGRLTEWKLQELAPMFRAGVQGFLITVVSVGGSFAASREVPWSRIIHPLLLAALCAVFFQLLLRFWFEGSAALQGAKGEPDSLKQKRPGKEKSTAGKRRNSEQTHGKK